MFWPPEMFFEKGFPKYFVKFTGKHLCWNLKTVTLLKRHSNTGVFLVNFATFKSLFYLLCLLLQWWQIVWQRLVHSIRLLIQLYKVSQWEIPVTRRNRSMKNCKMKATRFFSVTRRRRDINITLRLSSPVRKSSI